MRDGLDLVHMPIDGISWLVAGQDRERLLISARTGWNGRVIRVTPRRRVVWIDGEAGPLVLKHFLANRIGAALKVLLRGSPASREWTALHRARSRGLPVPQPVALGERKEGILRGESFLITEGLDEALPLKAVLFGEARVRGRKRWDLIRSVAVLLRQMHGSGLSQRDLHLGNILAKFSGGRGQLCLIDLHRSQIASHPTETIRWVDLAVLHGGCLEASLTDRFRFLKAYLAGPPPLAVELKSLVAWIEQRGMRHRFRWWTRRARRCVSENRDFCRIGIDGLVGFSRRAFQPEVVRHLFADTRNLFTHPGVRMLKDSRTTTVGLLPSPGGSLFVKRYNYQGLGYALKDLFRPSRARRVWIVANSLRMRGIPTPLVHTYLERRRFGFLLESYLITEGVEGIGLPEWLSRIHKSGASFLAKRLLITEIASVVRKLHTRGVSHRDLKGRNILILEKVPGRFEPLLVDLDGVRFGRVWLRRRAQDLARLAQAMSDQSAVTRTDRVRFLQAYLGPRGRASWKKLWSGIAMIQARLARSNASRRQ